MVNTQATVEIIAAISELACTMKIPERELLQDLCAIRDKAQQCIDHLLFGDSDD